VDIVDLFRPIAKWDVRIGLGQVIPETVWESLSVGGAGTYQGRKASRERGARLHCHLD
jgi:hypothetical protein